MQTSAVAVSHAAPSSSPGFCQLAYCHCINALDSKQVVSRGHTHLLSHLGLVSPHFRSILWRHNGAISEWRDETVSKEQASGPPTTLVQPSTCPSVRLPACLPALPVPSAWLAVCRGLEAQLLPSW